MRGKKYETFGVKLDPVEGLATRRWLTRVLPEPTRYHILRQDLI